MEPRKWKKHRTLVEWGIEPKAYLEDTKFRYPIEDYERCIDDIESKINDAEYDYNIAVLVPQRQTQFLPNLHFKAPEDFEETKRKLSKMDRSAFQEIWHIRNKSKDAVWGRQFFALDEMFPRFAPSHLELVKGMSLREANRGQLSPTASFMTFERQEKTYPFEIIKEVGQPIPEHQEITRKLSRYQKRFLEFATFLKEGFGCNGMAFDFNYSDNDLIVYDWDTGKDDGVLTKMETRGL